MIDYANILDELKEPLQQIEDIYAKAYEMARHLNDIFIQKTILYNLDIVFESRGMKNKRI